MSIKAFPVKKLELDKPLFDLWYDTQIKEALEDSGFLESLTDASGFVSIPIYILKDLLERYKPDKLEQLNRFIEEKDLFEFSDELTLYIC